MNRFLILLSAMLISVSLSGQDLRYSEVNISLSGKTIHQLASLGIPLDEGDMTREGTVRMILSEEELSRISQAGFSYETVTGDYSAFITERNTRLASLIESINHEIKDGMLTGGDYPVPQGFELGSMGGFYTLEEAYREMDSLHNAYPDLVSEKAVFNNTTTIEGRPIYYLKISDNPNVNEDEPRVLYDGLTHAREPIGMQQLFYFMNYLLEHYATDPEIQYLVNNVEMYFIPVMNPDGYHHNQMTNPIGGGMWRKNKRNNGDGTYGVDLNRNYGYMWGYDDQGSSPVTSDETYRGNGPFSEPETQIARDFCNDKDFKLALNYHSHGNVCLYAWSYITALTPDSTIFTKYSDLLTRDNTYITGTSGEVLYNTNGDMNDWLYGDVTQHPLTISFTPEIGGSSDGFWPLATRIIPLSQENMLANLLLAHLSYRYAEVRDESDAIIGDREGYFPFKITRYGLDSNGQYTVSIQPVDPAVITSVGNPVTFTSLALFESAVDSISFTLSPDLPVGEAFQFLLQINNGFYTHTDTITRYFGPPLVAFSDDGSSFSKWSSSKWNTTTKHYFSPSSSITDSPSGRYSNNESNSVIMQEFVDLSNSPVAVIEYMAWWDIENGLDYVQVAGTSATSFVPFAGRYTHPGGPAQATGEPVYDNVMNEWVKEQIVTTDYAGKDLLLRFTLNSDSWGTADGFYFDDMKITVIDMSCTGIDTPGAEGAWFSQPAPNPSDRMTSFRYRLPEGSTGPAWLKVYDLRGMEIYTEKVETRSGSITLNTLDLERGVYLCRLETAGFISPVRKLLIIH